MGIVLRGYQGKDYNSILESFKSHKSVLFPAPCGYGKSVLISHLANTLSGRVLVLTHREELLVQNSKLMLDYAVLDARAKKRQPLIDCKTVVCMAQTIIRRLEKFGGDYAGEFDTILIDECHLDFFEKIYNLIPHKNRLGLTATPVIDKTDKKKVDGVEFTRELTLRNQYDFLVQSVSEIDLIDLGYLVKDFNVVLQPDNLHKLKSSKSNADGYSSGSLNEVFGNNASMDTLFESWEVYGKGRKTIVFNPATKTNKVAYDYFVERIGEDRVRLFDSVNDNKYTRKETVDWFKSKKDAVLMNVGVFTTGFDVPELECILFNKKTKSLGLYLQIAGRGSRPAPNIGKTSFTFVDMGLNIMEHGTWSKKRDWSDFFVLKDWRRKKATDLLSIWECGRCGFFNPEGTVYNEKLDAICCGGCGEPKTKKKASNRFIKGKFVVMDEPVVPNANKLVEYALRVGGDRNMVFKMGKSQILDLFRFYTDKEDFFKNKKRYMDRVGELFRPIYFAVINRKDIKGKNRRLATELIILWSRIESLYD